MKLGKRAADRVRNPGPSTASPVPVVSRLDNTPRVSRTRVAPDSIGDRLLKVAVVFLCAVNALTWEYYTESRMMAIIWAAIAVGFVYWIIQDMRR